MSVRILTGDCREVLRTLPDESVHCVVSSPPYYALRDYGVAGQIGLERDYHAYIATMVEVFREIRRVLRNDGTVWLNLGDSYATGAGTGDWTGRPERGATSKAGYRGGTSSKRPAMGKHEYLGDRIAIGPMSQPNRMPQPGLKPKDLMGMPWRVAFALQDDGWWLRQDIVWFKPNPMPESVHDRCTKAHEYIFLLAKDEQYFYDAIAIKEQVTGNAHSRGDGLNPKARANSQGPGQRIKQNSSFSAAVADLVEERNKRSVWEVATQPFPEAHFATFPPALIEPCIKAGTSERGCCIHCGAGWERITGKVETGRTQKMPDGMATYAGGHTAIHKDGREKGATDNPVMASVTLGWYPSCTCDQLPALPPYPPLPSRAALNDERAYKAAMADWRRACFPIDQERKALCEKAGSVPVSPAVVLDPFGGAGTTGLVADRLQRDAVLVELNPEYAAMARRRIHGDAPLFSGIAAE